MTRRRPHADGFARLFPRSRGTLGELSFIHFARWTRVSRLPQIGPPQARQRLSYAHLFFVSNFNGGWEEYMAWTRIRSRAFGDVRDRQQAADEVAICLAAGLSPHAQMHMPPRTLMRSFATHGRRA